MIFRSCTESSALRILQLPYMFVLNRLAHYLKVIERENIGTWKERSDLQRELNNRITQYVTRHRKCLAGDR